MSEFTIRPAVPEDWPVIADFNCRLAGESEGKQLDPALVGDGVQALLADPLKGRYFVVCREENIVAQLMHTREWSDWRNGDIWWLQSVYVLPEFRRRGLFRMLYEHAFREAQNDANVVGLRLYVEQDNERAHETYSRLGMTRPGYFVMQKMLDR